MSYWTDSVIKELHLEIPKADFPLKNDLIVGYERPVMIYPSGECEQTTLEPLITEDMVIFATAGDDDEPRLRFHENYTNDIEVLEDLCKKYKGTLLYECTGEDGPTEYVCIRDGKEKKVKIIEED